MKTQSVKLWVLLRNVTEVRIALLFLFSRRSGGVRRSGCGYRSSRCLLRDQAVGFTQQLALRALETLDGEAIFRVKLVQLAIFKRGGFMLGQLCFAVFNS